MNLIAGRVGAASEPADTPTGSPAGLDVVIVTYQSAPHLACCLRSLPTEARVVVVDNNSTDDSAAIAGEHGVPVHRNAANRGFAAAANQGAAVGRADLILFLNPDAVVAPADLSRLAEAVLADDSVAVAGPRLVSPEGRDQRPWWPFPSPFGSWCEAAGLQRLGGRLGSRWAAVPGDAGAIDVAFVVGACFLVRRVAFEALGGFDEEFWLYGEEADFCRRAAAAGWRVRYVPQAQAVHVGGGSSSGADGDVVREHFALGTDRFIRKHRGRAALLSHRLALLAGSAARVALLAGRPDHPAATERRLLVRRQLATLRSGPLSLAQPARPGDAAAKGPRSRVADAPPPGQEELAFERRALSQVVVCSLEKWDETWRRNQFLVRELLAGDSRLRVLFVEPPVDMAYQALGRLLGRGRAEPSGERRGLRPLTSDRRLWALRPGKVLPRVAGPLADRSLRRQVRRAASTLGFDHPTLWINDSAYAGLLSEVGWPALYDITDDWLEATCTPRERRRRQDREKALLRRAAVVSACSQELVHRRGGRGVRLIPNAVDEHHFADPQPRPQDLPAGPCAVYVGTLHEDRLDVDLLVQVARSTQSASIVLVGPDALAPASRDRLASEANIHLLGARPYRDIPGYFQHADVVVVPHRVTSFTDSLDPIKAYEILAVGRPTVATPVAGFRELGLGPPVRCASGSAFVEAVRAALADPADSAPRPVPSWSERGAEFRRALIDAASTRRRLSVVYLDHCARLSGGEIALERLLSALEGVDAHVVLAEDGPLRGRLESAGISCEVLSMRAATLAVHRDEVRPRRLPIAAMAGSVTYVVRLTFRLRMLQPDLVHSNSLKSGIYGSLSCRLAGIPMVWHVRDRIAVDYLPRPAVWLVQTMLRVLPAAVIANSVVTRDTLGPVTTSRRCLVVHCSGPVPADAARSSSAPAVGAGGGEWLAAPFVVGMVGRLAPWKGQDIFVEAFAKAFPAGPERAVIVGAALFGETDFEAQLRELIAQLGLGHRVDFLGFREDVDVILPAFDVLVHASRTAEPFGQVIVEAMASGVPVVAAGAGGPREIVDPEVSGLLFPPGDVDGLAAALLRLREDADLRQRLASNGRRRALDFTPEVTGAKVCAVYDQVLSLR